jgi:hypothetical protein
LVDQEVLDTDAEHFDCATCPVAEAQSTLDRENVEAWQLYGRVCTRFAVDVGLVGDVLRAHVEGWPAADVVDLMERFAVLYDVLSPPPKRMD